MKKIIPMHVKFVPYKLAAPLSETALRETYHLQQSKASILLVP